MPGRLTVTVPRVDIGGNSLPQFHRVWLARLDPHIRLNKREPHLRQSGNPQPHTQQYALGDGGGRCRPCRYPLTIRTPHGSSRFEPSRTLPDPAMSETSTVSGP